MGFQLVVILVMLMVTNQILGTGYGSWKSGFSSELFFRGIKKIVLIFIGYGAIALTAHYAADYIPKVEYLNGILLDPIARYFTKVCESLKSLINESTKSTSEPPKLETDYQVHPQDTDSENVAMK